MKPKYIGAAVFAAAFILGYNAFLIKRDAELFKAYDKQVKYDHPTPKEAFCKSQAKWHPDCDVE